MAGFLVALSSDTYWSLRVVTCFWLLRETRDKGRGLPRSVGASVLQANCGRWRDILRGDAGPALCFPGQVVKKGWSAGYVCGRLSGQTIFFGTKNLLHSARIEFFGGRRLTLVLVYASGAKVAGYLKSEEDSPV